VRTYRLAGLAVLVLVVAACTIPTRPALTEFADVPIPKGLTYDPDRSTVIETPTVKAVRLVYRGRIELQSLAGATRNGLEAAGWRLVTTSTTSQPTTTQRYEKGGSSLQIVLWEGFWYTYLELTAGRAVPGK
jgi:hypothetical protein